MSLRSEWPCWEIMKCDDGKECPAKEQPAKMCWEIIQETESRSSHICTDCLVYITRQKDCQFSREEILSIMAQKGINVLDRSKCPCPQFKDSEEE
jgi:hypothetical protein